MKIFFERLYKEHFKYWQNKLERLIIDNCLLHDHIYGQTGINYAGRNWVVENRFQDKPTTPINEYACWPVHPKLDQKELVEVTANLGEMEVEMHEGKRFLSGLILYPAPADKFQKILGDVLYLPASKEFEDLAKLRDKDEWTPLAEENMDEFAKYADFVIDAMAERVLLNMIGKSAIAQG